MALTKKEFDDVAKLLGCETEAIQAVAQVESGSMGAFYKDGFPVILFEPHIFHRYTNGVHAAKYPHLSYARWGALPYPKSAGVRANFAQACALNLDAAIQSTSFGLFQVMGFHWKKLGYLSPSNFFEMMRKDEKEHLLVFVRFIQANNLADELQNKDWAAFARQYNGSGYAKNRYDTKMAEAYAKLKAGG